MEAWSDFYAIKARPGSLFAEFYTDGWVPEMESKFLYDLMVYANIEGRSLCEDNRHVITCAMLFINNRFKTNFDYYYIFKQFQFAHKRFVTMNWIVNYPAVLFNEETEVITASKKTWDIICKVHHLGRVYRVCKEPFWQELKTIFAFDRNGGKKNVGAILDSDEYKFKTPCFVEESADSPLNDDNPPDHMSSNVGPARRLPPPCVPFRAVKVFVPECSQPSSTNSCSVNDY